LTMKYSANRNQVSAPRSPRVSSLLRSSSLSRTPCTRTPSPRARRSLPSKQSVPQTLEEDCTIDDCMRTEERIGTRRKKTRASLERKGNAGILHKRFEIVYNVFHHRAPHPTERRSQKHTKKSKRQRSLTLYLYIKIF
jgi:hypothetical protein